MNAVDQVFQRAGATLARTCYQWRCWVNTYHKDDFWTNALRALPSQRDHISVWKRLICYVFRVLACAPRERKQIYNLTFRPQEIQMMDYILALLEEVEEGVEAEEDDPEDDEWDYNDEEGEEGGGYCHGGSDDDEDEEESGEEGDEDEEEGGRDELEDGGEREQSGYTLPSGPMLKLSEALFQLSMMFWTYQDPAGEMATSILVHFTAVLGIHRHSLAYRSAYNSTSGFARLTWIGRLLFLEYALPLHAYNEDSTPF
jgi:hypothetical protein